MSYYTYTRVTPVRLYYTYCIKVVLPPPVHFWKCTNVCHTKHMAETPIPFVWERPQAPQHGRTSHTKYMRTTPGAGGKRKALYIGDPRRHGFPREVSKGAYRVERSGVAVYTTNRVRQCVFSPLSYWIHGGAAGDKYTWLFST